MSEYAPVKAIRLPAMQISEVFPQQLRPAYVIDNGTYMAARVDCRPISLLQGHIVQDI